MVLDYEKIKKIQKQILDKMDMSEEEAVKYAGASTPDGSIRIGKIDEVIKGVHKLANLNPQMDSQEYEQLKQSLLSTGQQEPILVYRGYVVDGRHRLKALKDLSCDFVIYENIPRNTSLNELKEIVMSKNARRNLSKSQKAIQAYFDYLKHGGSKTDLAIRHGVDRTYVTKAETVAKKLGTEVLEKLLSNGSVKLDNGRYYSNLSSIISYIKKKETLQKEKVEYEPQDEFINKITKKIMESEPDIEQLAQLKKWVTGYIDKKNKEE